MKSKLVVAVEFGDTDPAAIAFYPNFFRWFDASAWRLFAKAGLTFDVFREEFGLIGAPIVEARSKFIKPLRFEDSIEITSYVASWKRKTFKLVHEVRKEGEVCAEGLEIRVCETVRSLYVRQEQRVILPGANSFASRVGFA